MLALIASWQPTMARDEITASLRIADRMLETAQRGSIDSNRTYAHIFQANSCMMLCDLRGASQHLVFEKIRGGGSRRKVPPEIRDRLELT